MRLPQKAPDRIDLVRVLRADPSAAAMDPRRGEAQGADDVLRICLPPAASVRGPGRITARRPAVQKRAVIASPDWLLAR